MSTKREYKHSTRSTPESKVVKKVDSELDKNAYQPNLKLRSNATSLCENPLLVEIPMLTDEKVCSQLRNPIAYPYANAKLLAENDIKIIEVRSGPFQSTGSNETENGHNSMKALQHAETIQVFKTKAT